MPVMVMVMMVPLSLDFHSTRPPSAVYVCRYPPQGMPPQGMAPQGMQYYPVVPAPQGMQYYPVQAHQMQQLQMYTPSQQVGVGVQPSNTNMFFKTRLCNKWRSGMCPFGDKCTYAHGQHEMRQLDPQVLMQQQMYAGGMPAGMQGGMAGGMQGGMQGHHGDKGRYGRRGEGEKTQLYYKTRWVLVSTTDCIVEAGHAGAQTLLPRTDLTRATGIVRSFVRSIDRLCIRFMQSGYCTRGNECTFAHGYDDLRLMAKSDEVGDRSIGRRRRRRGRRL